MTLREYVEGSIKKLEMEAIPQLQADLQANFGALQAFKNMLHEMDRDDMEAKSDPTSVGDPSN